ncbi:hypothetical protein MJ258_10085 [Legionella sp. EUR-108]|uniref:Uncharacterized protein n=1 Tax=Legionella maioricensis TaxID=2896528 RepID=A0A9X2D1U6_9GAMM|nr:hypothetical protein [Legionella maioricensis]MCL9687866.1 hypothetical protein [Legionella maioricensis]
MLTRADINLDLTGPDGNTARQAAHNAGQSEIENMIKEAIKIRQPIVSNNPHPFFTEPASPTSFDVTAPDRITPPKTP